MSFPCKVCSRPTTMWCSQCRQAWYCTPQHLESDWPRHSAECAPMSPTAFPTAVAMMPPLITVSALLFAPEQERPQIVTINCQPKQMLRSGSPPTPLVQVYFAESQPQSLTITQGLNGDPLRFPLQLFYCPVAVQRGGPANRAIYGITSGAARKPWPGTVLVLKYSGSRKQGYSDAGINDLPALSAYFLKYQ